MTPAIGADIMKDIENLTNNISIGQKHIKSSDRKLNIKITKGMIRDHFVRADVAAFSHGPGLLIDFENSIRRSRTETARYEFKQGILRLDSERSADPDIKRVLLETICGIANIGPEADGFVYMGIADKEADGNRVRELYQIEPIKFDHVIIVGVEREAAHIGVSLDKYMRRIEDTLKNSELSDPLKTQVLSSLDVVDYKGLSIVRIRVPKQTAISFIAVSYTHLTLPTM